MNVRSIMDGLTFSLEGDTSWKWSVDLGLLFATLLIIDNHSELSEGVIGSLAPESSQSNLTANGKSLIG